MREAGREGEREKEREGRREEEGATHAQRARVS